MTWIKDDIERFVNIEKWDFLNWQSIEDRKMGESIAYKIYLENTSEEKYVLGYINCKGVDPDDILKQITLGFQPNFYDLENIIYYYLDKEFDDGIDCENFNEKYKKRMEKINELINTRFFETE
jgi:hypothetical protein